VDANGKRSTAVLAASAALFASSAAASETSQSAIVVTGERASRTLLETPSSVTVVNHDDLETHAGADRLDQILTGIPNVQLGSGGEGPTIRGQDSTGVLRDLPAFLGGTRPRVTLQVDGRPISYNELAFGISGLWDLAQIEVFRSPQTTTQGRNAIAGAIFIETQDPTFDWQGRLRMAAGNYAARQASAAVSGPLIADQLALRIAGDIRRNNTTTSMTSAASGADANRDKYELLRVKLVARPIGIPSLKLTGTYTHTSSVTPQIEGLRPPYRARRDGTATYGIFSTNVDSLTLRADYPLTDGLTAKATGWLGAAHIRRFAPPGFGESDNDASDRGGELILTARPSTGLTVTLGTNVACRSSPGRSSTCGERRMAMTVTLCPV